MHYPDRLEILPLTTAPHATVCVPGSKSITNRALVLAALTTPHGRECLLEGALRSEDTEVMVESLGRLGFIVEADWPRVRVTTRPSAAIVPAAAADLFVANSGTTMRFLTALVALGHGRYRLDGVPRMRERPIQDLLDALGQLGVRAVSELGNGCPPVVIETTGLSGGRVEIKGNTSSQFLSGLLMAAPFAEGETYVVVDGPLVSAPYVQMTVGMLRQFGLKVAIDIPEPEIVRELREISRQHGHPVGPPCTGYGYRIPGRQRGGVPGYRIEPDASAASYFFGAAAITGGSITVTDLPGGSLQGDVRFVKVIEQMGCHARRDRDAVTVTGGPLHGIDVDMNDISDTVMTLGAVACFADGPTTIRNVAHIRHKETDRLAALAAELRRIGARVDERDDGLTITPAPLHGAVIQTYHDHRMAMSLALVGLKVPGVVIDNPGCVAKTYPDFFADLERLR